MKRLTKVYPKAKYNHNSVILHEDDLRVVIAAGLKSNSTNTKTGGMIQIYILHRTINPLEAIKTGDDEAICGNCPHRGVPTEIDGIIKMLKRRCYVQVGKAPNGMHKAYVKGRYRKVEISEYPALFGGRLVRFGAYGDPVYIPLDIIEAITAVCLDWTGYTHQWRDAQYAAYKAYVMASCDNERDAIDAAIAGWRMFRVRAKNAPVLPGEIVCPASVEAGKRTTCEKCRLCNGTKYGPADKRKNIVIIDHSVIANTQPLIQIAA